MSVTEAKRNDLFNWCEEHMGKERAATLMSMLPSAGWADVATKRDLDVLAERLETKVERLDAKVDDLAARLDGKVDDLAARLDSKVDTLQMKADLNELRSDLQRTFITWILTAQATVVAAIGLLLVALH